MEEENKEITRREAIKRIGTAAAGFGLGVGGATALGNVFGNSYNDRKMKVLLVNGSPHKEGCTYTALSEIAGSFPNVLAVLSGMTYMEHLQDNLRSFCPLKPLTDNDTAFLYETADLMVQYPTIPCNDCKYCMPCPYGLDIPAILLHYNKCVNQGNVPESQQAENYREARQAFLVGYDRSVPKLRQASHCIS